MEKIKTLSIPNLLPNVKLFCFFSSSPIKTFFSFMYWSAHGVIEGAELDGSNRKIIAFLVTSFSHRDYDAQSLAVDVAQNRVYFVSRYNIGIFYVDLNAGDGNVHELFVDFFFVLYPFGIALDDDYVYWNDYFREAVFRTKKNNSSRIETVVSGLFYPRGMYLYKENATRNSKFFV